MRTMTWRQGRLFGAVAVGMMAAQSAMAEPSELLGLRSQLDEVTSRLEEEGLVVRADKELSLTAGGRRLWRELEARHRVIQSFMVDVLGMDDAAAYEEACRLEHYATQNFVDRLAAHQRDLMGRSL
jgi:Mn-dependent DtxR family transcriptional regulator